MPWPSEQRAVELLLDEDVVELVDERREVVAVDDLPPRALRQREIVGDLGVRQDYYVVPAQPALSPAVVLLNEFAQRITGFAGLADRIDPVLVAASPLPPRVTVVPDVAALDLETDNAGALDRDDEVHLMVLEVIGDTLAGNHPVVWLKLFQQGLVDIALGGNLRWVGRRAVVPPRGQTWQTPGMTRRHSGKHPLSTPLDGRPLLP